MHGDTAKTGDLAGLRYWMWDWDIIFGMSEQLQLQISLSIGSQCYQIKVPKQAELPQLVREFLARNRLNPKYQASIVRMVLEKLEQHAATTRRNTPNRQSKRPQQQKQAARPVVAEQVTKDKQQKMKQVSKVQQSEEPKDNFQDSRRIFQAWKLKEKEKEKKAKEAKSKHQTQTTRSPFEPQRRQSDYFYKKGLQFQKSRELSCEKLFKQHYPFKTRERVLTESDQAKLYDKLHYQRKGSQCSHFPAEDPSLQREHRPSDPVKAFLRRQDDKIDRQIHKMLRSGYLTPNSTTSSNGRSVFRKTILN